MTLSAVVSLLVLLVCIGVLDLAHVLVNARRVKREPVEKRA